MPYRDPERRTLYHREYKRLKRAGDCQTPGQTLVPMPFRLKTAHDVLALDREERLEAFRRLSIRPYALLTRASVIKLAESLDAAGDPIVHSGHP